MSIVILSTRCLHQGGASLSFRVQFDENAVASATNLAAEAGTGV
jgi:hypothetical protein